MTKERLQQLNELGLKLREVKQTEAKLIRTTEKSLQRRNDLDVLHEEKNKLKKEVSALTKVKDMLSARKIILKNNEFIETSSIKI